MFVMEYHWTLLSRVFYSLEINAHDETFEYLPHLYSNNRQMASGAFKKKPYVTWVVYLGK